MGGAHLGPTASANTQMVSNCWAERSAQSRQRVYAFEPVPQSAYEPPVQQPLASNLNAGDALPPPRGRAAIDVVEYAPRNIWVAVSRYDPEATRLATSNALRFGEQIAERYSQVTRPPSLRPLGWVHLTAVREENGGPDGPIPIRHGLAVDRYAHRALR
ncbi:hypothetical protein BQ8482_30041 [Mesorhizobium delmotii]|uniref:Uncharacterized protein n=1 Tax=Mesorhizobium delmotii TaxID=1631247 RepID=A0A2P9AN68_9HYPH|nr:hypothetical protein BQ8482_30041 [Mesorhizobium delmotii]